MTGQFYLWAAVQGLILFLILFRTGLPFSSPTTLFAPASWFVLFYMLCFWLPQLFMPAFDFMLIGAYNEFEVGQIGRIVETQKVLCVFLLTFMSTYLVSARRSLAGKTYLPLRRTELNFGLLMGTVGLFAVVVIILGLDPDEARSEIVASRRGRVLYAISFWFTLGFFVWAAYLLTNSRWLLLICLVTVFASCLLLLGGRGRVLWPLVGLVVWAGIAGHAKFRRRKLVVAAAMFGVLLQALDPILLYVRGHDSADEAVDRFESGLELETLFFARNFDSFHNVAVIVGEDRIRPDLGYLINGSQAAFMNAYFPTVQASGVGYPATLPGGLWLSGKWTMTIVGGCVFGLLFGYLSRLYGRMSSELEVAVYCMAMPWLAHVGISYLESYLKVAALILPGVLLAIILRRRPPRTSYAKRVA